MMIEPEKMEGADCHIAIEVEGERCGLHFRNHILCPTSGTDAPHTLSCTRTTWDGLLTGSVTLTEALNTGAITIHGDTDAVISAFSALDHPAFTR